jgi:hypothetical protein
VGLRCAALIALVKKRSTRFLKNMHKFGIEVPRSVAEAYALDKKNGNTLRADSIAKEMKNVWIAFKILANGDKVPIGFQHMRCHMIFDIKMEDLHRKSRLVAGGHMTDAPATTTFASMVSRKTVRIAVTLAGLNDLQVPTSPPNALRKCGPSSVPNLDQMLGRAPLSCAHSMV